MSNQISQKYILELEGQEVYKRIALNRQWRETLNQLKQWIQS